MIISYVVFGLSYTILKFLFVCIIVVAALTQILCAPHSANESVVSHHIPPLNPPQEIIAALLICCMLPLVALLASQFTPYGPRSQNQVHPANSYDHPIVTPEDPIKLLLIQHPLAPIPCPGQLFLRRDTIRQFHPYKKNKNSKKNIQNNDDLALSSPIPTQESH